MFVSLHLHLPGPSGDVWALGLSTLCSNSFLRTRQMLKHEKTCVIPIFKTSDEPKWARTACLDKYDYGMPYCNSESSYCPDACYQVSVQSNIWFVRCSLKNLAECMWASMRENLSSVVWEQQRCRPACTSTQSNQCLWFSFFGKWHI